MRSIHRFVFVVSFAVAAGIHLGRAEAAFHVYPPSRPFSLQAKTLTRRRSNTPMIPPKQDTATSIATTPLFSSTIRVDSGGGNLTPKSTSSSRRTTMVYALILVNLAVFMADKFFPSSFVQRNLYMFHARWKWWQPLTSCFCHADKTHLSNNLFLLLLFGRSVEDDFGSSGLLASYILCGVVSSWVSLALLSKYTVSIGASGAVFGLFAVSMLIKLSWREILDWRKVVELAVLGEFVFRQVASEVATAATGGTAGINHVAHLSGAVTGAAMVWGMRMTVARFERAERKSGGGSGVR